MKYIITNKQYQLLKEDEQEILDIPSVELFGGWDGLQEYLKRKGNPLYSIGGELNLAYTEIKSLGNLISVGGDLNLYGTPIKSLGNLISVGGDLNLFDNPIKSLGNLKSVGGSLDLSFTKIPSLGKLRYVGKELNILHSKIYETHTEQEIHRKVFIGGVIVY